MVPQGWGGPGIAEPGNNKAGLHPSVRPAWSCCCLKQRAPERTRTSNLLIRSGASGVRRGSPKCVSAGQSVAWMSMNYGERIA
jgi:hypothetical protein